MECKIGGIFMANYYYVSIESEKMTQDVASEIFQRIASQGRVRHFEFQQGFLNYNSRGLADIDDILSKHGFTNEEINIKDEFQLYREE
jgi:hypothetical protein